MRLLPALSMAAFPVFLPLHFLPGWNLMVGSRVGEVRWGLVLWIFLVASFWTVVHLASWLRLGHLTSRLGFYTSLRLDPLSTAIIGDFDCPSTEPCLGRWSARGTLQGLGERRPRGQATMLWFGLLNFKFFAWDSSYRRLPSACYLQIYGTITWGHCPRNWGNVRTQGQVWFLHSSLLVVQGRRPIRRIPVWLGVLLWLLRLCKS